MRWFSPDLRRDTLKRGYTPAGKRCLLDFFLEWTFTSGEPACTLPWRGGERAGGCYAMDAWECRALRQVGGQAGRALETCPGMSPFRIAAAAFLRESCQMVVLMSAGVPVRGKDRACHTRGMSVGRNAFAMRVPLWKAVDFSFRRG